MSPESACSVSRETRCGPRPHKFRGGVSLHNKEMCTGWVGVSHPQPQTGRNAALSTRARPPAPPREAGRAPGPGDAPSMPSPGSAGPRPHSRLRDAASPSRSVWGFTPAPPSLCWGMGCRTQVNRRRGHVPSARLGPWGVRSGSRGPRGALPCMGVGGGQRCFPGNPGSPAWLPRESNRRSAGPCEPQRQPGWKHTHLGQATPVLGVLPAQHLL